MEEAVPRSAQASAVPIAPEIVAGLVLNAVPLTVAEMAAAKLPEAGLIQTALAV